ncbi:MAG: cupredoxin domain-containing protein [Thermomicrobiales bacterium]
MTNTEIDPTVEETDQPSRRWMLRSIVGAGLAVGIAGIGWSKLAVADNDDEDDDDNSGSGGGGHDDSEDDHSGRDHAEDDGNTQANSSPVADVTTINIRDETFIPANIIIDPGQTVTWNNLDDDEHTATGATFDTGTLDRGESGEVRFDTPGVYVFVCQFHAEMQGSVTVRGEVATPIASPEASPASAGETASVSIIDLAFDPAALTVPSGTNVIWTNTGQIPHTVTGSFYSSDILQPGDAAEYVFTTAGTFSYICALHDGMSGTITVA